MAATPGPSAAGSWVQATASCPGGSTLGGGFNLHTSSGAVPNNSLRALGGVPSSADGSPVSAGVPPSWTTIGGAGGQSMTDAVTDGYVVCAANGPSGLKVVAQSVSGPSTPASSVAVTASCPSGTELVGGGASTLVPPSPIQPSLHLIGSYPSDAGGHAPGSGPGPSSWTAVGAAGGAQITNATTTAYAVCATGTLSVSVVAVSATGPEAASTPMAQTATCPAGTVLLDGGVDVTLNGSTPQQGLHITGDYPSVGGVPVANGGTGSAWTAITQSGGQPTPGTQTSAFALCSASG